MLAERALLRGLGGGCLVPIGVRTRVEGEQLFLDGAVLTPDGKQRVAGQTSGAAKAAEALGQQLADQLLRLGAQALLNT